MRKKNKKNMKNLDDSNEWNGTEMCACEIDMNKSLWFWLCKRLLRGDWVQTSFACIEYENEWNEHCESLQQRQIVSF